MESTDLNKCEGQQSTEQLDPCTIGLIDNLTKCHSMGFYANKFGFKFFNDFDAKDQELLSKRTDLKFTEESRICLQHESYFLTKYEQRQKYCCNPFLKEKHSTKKSLKVIDSSTADKLNQVLNKNVKPGQKWCISCCKEFKVKLSEESSSPDSNQDVSNQDVEMEASVDASTSLTSLGLSPLKFQKVSKRDSLGYAKRKAMQAQKSICSKIAAAGRLQEYDIGEASSSQKCENCEDYNQLLEELKIKCQEVALKEKVQILTLAPKSWSIKKTAEEFRVSIRTVKQARKLGLLAIPEKKQGKKLSEDTKDCVKNFFEDDEFSRICPGKKDYVAVRIDGKKYQKQKRLLLCNLREMFKAYQERNLPKIGFSKFCELRPKWCVTVGSSGTHSICVCTIHQNVKLMLAGSHIEEDYKFLINKTVCSLESKDCMLHRCEQCPGEEALKNYLVAFFKDKNPEEIIEYKQWIHTDRDTLDTKQLSTEDFVNELSYKIWNLSNHHYIAKHQSGHLKFVKENLKMGEIVILMDFAENYSFVVQDSIQGFHWENSQATLHPFVVYYKDIEKLQCDSICVISDCLRHDTVAVHIYLVHLIEYLKQLVGVINYIYYFSDGSAAQYKNYKNFINLCYHERDFSIAAEWNFFGTSHGKSPCDGIGGTVKRQAARASLQRPLENQILTPHDLFLFCQENLSGIKSFYIQKEEVEAERPKQEERFKCGYTVAGTRDNHQFVPVDQNTIRVSKVSNDTTSFKATIHKHTEIHLPATKIANLQPGQYIACVYDENWWIGNICEISDEEHDALVNFMHPHGPAQAFYWPARNDSCWIPEDHVIANIPAPSATSMGRHYSLSPELMLSISEKLSVAIK